VNSKNDKKCGYTPCGCVVAAGAKYCSSCCESASGKLSITCCCEHAGCVASADKLNAETILPDSGSSVSSRSTNTLDNALDSINPDAA